VCEPQASECSSRSRNDVDHAQRLSLRDSSLPRRFAGATTSRKSMRSCITIFSRRFWRRLARGFSTSCGCARQSRAMMAFFRPRGSRAPRRSGICFRHLRSANLEHARASRVSHVDRRAPFVDAGTAAPTGPARTAVGRVAMLPLAPRAVRIDRHASDQHIAENCARTWKLLREECCGFLFRMPSRRWGA
jgi:hypothetical protein